MKKICFYLKADLKRLLYSARFMTAVALTVGALLFGALEGIDLDAGVLYVFSLVMYGMPARMILVCACVSFADSFCEDSEHKYMMQQIIRGNAGAYISARMVSIFLAAMLTTVLGIFLFVNILHFHLAWVETSGIQLYDGLLRAGGFRVFLQSRKFELYFLCYGIQYGCLSGILSLWASYLSMYISNRMLVLSAPMILCYFADYLLAGIFRGTVSLDLIFSPSNNLFSDDLYSVLSAAAITVVNFALLRMLMVWKIRRKIYE